MTVFNDESASRINTKQIRTIAGVSLIIFGCLVALWVLLSIYGIFTAPDDYTILQKFSSMDENIETTGTPRDTMQILPGFFGIAGYGIVIIMLGISMGIANILLRTGSNLLQSDFKALVKQLGEELARLPRKLSRPQGPPKQAR